MWYPSRRQYPNTNNNQCCSNTNTNQCCSNTHNPDEKGKNENYFYLGNHKYYSFNNYNNFFEKCIDEGNMNHKFDVLIYGEKYEQNGKYKNYPYNPRILK